jgi:hypothetical protein
VYDPGVNAVRSLDRIGRDGNKAHLMDEILLDVITVSMVLRPKRDRSLDDDAVYKTSLMSESICWKPNGGSWCQSRVVYVGVIDEYLRIASPESDENELLLSWRYCRFVVLNGEPDVQRGTMVKSIDGAGS